MIIVSEKIGGSAHTLASHCIWLFNEIWGLECVTTCMGVPRSYLLIDKLMYIQASKLWWVSKESQLLKGYLQILKFVSKISTESCQEFELATDKL